MDRVGQVPDRYLSEEQRLMRQTSRRYVDEVVRPFISANREREWLFEPAERLPAEILTEADQAGLRGLGVPDRYGGSRWTRPRRRRHSRSSPPRSRGATPVWPTSSSRTGRSPSCCDRWPPRISRTPGSEGTWPTRSS